MRATVGRYRYVVALLLFLANAINYLDRSALSIVAPLVSKELHFNPAQLGLVFSAFFVGYSVFCFVGGYCSDRFGPKRTFAVAMAWWSVFCGATALVTGFASLLILRVLFGLGEGPMGSTTNKSVTNWFPREQAGATVGFANAGNPIGGAISGPIVGLVAVAYGWRVSFVVIMLIGFAWIVLWQVFMTDTPDDNPRVGAAERALVANSRAASAAAGRQDRRGISAWLLSAPVLAIALAFFSFNYMLYFFLTWLPSYLTDVFHQDIRHMSVLAVIPWVVGSVGMFSGGLISDALFRRIGNAVLARKIVLIGGLTLAAIAAVAAAEASTVGVALALIATANFCLMLAPNNFWVLVQEQVPADRVGGVGGFVHFLSNTAGIFGPALTGFIIQYGGGYGPSFVLTGAIAVAGALAVLIFVRAPAAASAPWRSSP